MSFDFNYTHLVAQDIVENINKALFAEPLGKNADPAKTATEITMRSQMDLERAGSFFSRLGTELVEQTINRVLHVLKREGIIPTFEVDGKEVKLRHTAPVAKMADLEDVQNLQQAISAIGILGEQNVLDTFKASETSLYMLDKLSIPTSLFNTVQERDEIVKQRTEQQQAQQQAEMALEAAKVAPKQQQ